jgi:hypothetical protein
MKTDYDEVSVYRIDDGEMHHYVADGMLAALQEHFNLMDPDDDVELTVSYVPGDRLLGRSEECGLTEEFPATFTIKQLEDQSPLVTTTAAEWAEYYAKDAPIQIMSTVF